MANRLKDITVKRDTNTLNRFYKNIEYPEIPVNNSDMYIISKSTDRLDLLAQDYYNDSQLWWVISKANPDKITRDSFFINPGLQIRIPSNIEEIYNMFSKLNR
jgi:hypothetical protein